MRDSAPKDNNVRTERSEHIAKHLAQVESKPLEHGPRLRIGIGSRGDRYHLFVFSRQRSISSPDRTRRKQIFDYPVGIRKIPDLASRRYAITLRNQLPIACKGGAYSCTENDSDCFPGTASRSAMDLTKKERDRIIDKIELGRPPAEPLGQRCSQVYAAERFQFVLHAAYAGDKIERAWNGKDRSDWLRCIGPHLVADTVDQVQKFIAG
jgi:hypothetical protein